MNNLKLSLNILSLEAKLCDSFIKLILNSKALTQRTRNTHSDIWDLSTYEDFSCFCAKLSSKRMSNISKWVQQDMRNLCIRQCLARQPCAESLQISVFKLPNNRTIHQLILDKKESWSSQRLSCFCLRLFLLAKLSAYKTWQMMKHPSKQLLSSRPRMTWANCFVRKMQFSFHYPSCIQFLLEFRSRTIDIARYAVLDTLTYTPTVIAGTLTITRSTRTTELAVNEMQRNLFKSYFVPMRSVNSII